MYLCVARGLFFAVYRRHIRIFCASKLARSGKKEARRTANKQSASWKIIGVFIAQPRPKSYCSIHKFEKEWAVFSATGRKFCNYLHCDCVFIPYSSIAGWFHELPT